MATAKARPNKSVKPVEPEDETQEVPEEETPAGQRLPQHSEGEKAATEELEAEGEVSPEVEIDEEKEAELLKSGKLSVDWKRGYKPCPVCKNYVSGPLTRECPLDGHKFPKSAKRGSKASGEKVTYTVAEVRELEQRYEQKRLDYEKASEQRERQIAEEERERTAQALALGFQFVSDSGGDADQALEQLETLREFVEECEGWDYAITALRKVAEMKAKLAK